MLTYKGHYIDPYVPEMAIRGTHIDLYVPIMDLWVHILTIGTGQFRCDNDGLPQTRTINVSLIT